MAYRLADIPADNSTKTNPRRVRQMTLQARGQRRKLRRWRLSADRYRKAARAADTVAILM